MSNNLKAKLGVQTRIEFENTIKEALNVLNKKNFAFIMHGCSFPSLEDENTGIGSANSSGARKFIDFASNIFNSIQLGPAGKTKAVDSSPYTGTIFSNNPLFIDIKELATSKWGNILSEATFEQIVQNNPSKGQSKVAYSYIFNAQDKALREAFQNYKAQEANLGEIKSAFEQYKQENISWLEKDALYEALSVKNGNDYWPIWQDETDKNLFNPKTKEESKACAKRLQETQTQFSNEIEFYSFCQFIASAQKEAIKEYALSKGIKLIADRQVAFSDRDCWANQALFLQGWNLGCPPDYFSKDGQAWGFPVMDPEKLFNKNGSLGEGGQLLKAVFSKMFKENPGGVRIDHIIGLVDPWVYKNGKKPKSEEGAGRLFSSPEHPELSKYAIATLEDIDTEYDSDSEFRVKKLTPAQISQYAAILEKIVIASAQEQGLTKKDIICEDLGTLTFPVEKVMEQFELSGMRLTQFVKPEIAEHPYRGINTEPHTWIMVGTHDNEPISFWAKALVNTHEGYLHAKNLCEDIVKDEAQREACIIELSKNAEKLAQMKLVELFTANSENAQIFFTDFFGIDDVYNKPGTSGDQNWSLRLPDNFEEFYYEQMAKGKGMNLPEILKRAIESKFYDSLEDKQELLNKLEEFSNLLKG